MKIIKLLLVALLLVSCGQSSQTTKGDSVQIDRDSINNEVAVEVKNDNVFLPNETIDFSKLIIGEYDRLDVPNPVDMSVGTHLVDVKVIKGFKSKVVQVSYGIIEPLEYQIADNIQFETDAPLDFTPFVTGNYDTLEVLESTANSAKLKIIKMGQEVTVDVSYKIIDNQSQESGEDYLVYPNSQPATLREDSLILVNKQYRLGEDYVPSDLILVDSVYSIDGSDVYLASRAYSDMVDMIESAAQAGLTIRITSCYRSFERQKAIYQYYLQSDPQEVVDTYSARPGYSEHQTGLACDFSSATAELGDFTGTPEQQWLAENAYQYGFIWRYRADIVGITGYQEETWHFRYVGKEVAKKVESSKMSFEDYYFTYIER